MADRVGNAQRAADQRRQRSLRHFAKNLRRDLGHSQLPADDVAAALERVARELREDPVAQLRWRALSGEVQP